MIPEIMPLVVSGVSGAIAALLSWVGRRHIRETEVLLRNKDFEVILGDPRSLDPEDVERRIRVLDKIAPDAGLVEAWRTLEAMISHDLAGHDPNAVVQGGQLRDYLLREGLVDEQDASLIDSLWNARNAVLHMRKSVAAGKGESYLPLILKVAARLSGRSGEQSVASWNLRR